MVDRDFRREWDRQRDRELHSWRQYRRRATGGPDDCRSDIRSDPGGAWRAAVQLLDPAILNECAGLWRLHCGGCAGGSLLFVDGGEQRLVGCRVRNRRGHGEWQRHARCIAEHRRGPERYGHDCRQDVHSEPGCLVRGIVESGFRHGCGRGRNRTIDRSDGGARLCVDRVDGRWVAHHYTRCERHRQWNGGIFGHCKSRRCANGQSCHRWTNVWSDATFVRDVAQSSITVAASDRRRWIPD